MKTLLTVGLLFAFAAGAEAAQYEFVLSTETIPIRKKGILRITNQAGDGASFSRGDQIIVEDEEVKIKNRKADRLLHRERLDKEDAEDDKIFEAIRVGKEARP